MPDAERQTIMAVDLKPGDRWIGEEPSNWLLIEVVSRGELMHMIPWTDGRTGTPELMSPVVITGQYIRSSDNYKFNGTWLLQPDQPVEIERD